jgi:hypothetical protein
MLLIPMAVPDTTILKSGPPAPWPEQTGYKQESGNARTT